MTPNENWVTVASDISGDTRAYTVGNLRPSRTYEFRLAAVSDLGNGAYSVPERRIQIPQQRRCLGGGISSVLTHQAHV